MTVARTSFVKKRLRKKKNLGEFERSYAQLTLDVGADASASKIDQLFDLLIDWAETHQFMAVVGHAKGDPVVRMTTTPRRGLSDENINAAWFDLMRRLQDALASRLIQSFESKWPDTSGDLLASGDLVEPLSK